MVSINVYAFEDCVPLKTIDCANGIQTFGEGSFAGCTALETVTIPKSTKTIGYIAFKNCVNLRNVYFNA